MRRRSFVGLSTAAIMTGGAVTLAGRSARAVRRGQ